MKKNILLVGMLFGLFCLTSEAQAGAISYSKNGYSATAAASGYTTMFDPLFGAYGDSLVIQDNNLDPNPPVSASVKYKFPGSAPDLLPGGDADATASGNISLLEVNGSIYGGVVAAQALIHHEREFWANFPELAFSCDYYLYAEKKPSVGPGIASGQVNTAVTLFDETASSTSWTHNLEKNGSITFPEDELPITGAIDEVFPLIIGHTYSLSVDLSLDFWASGDDRLVFGTARISNSLVFSAVPLPATLGLVAWGLLSLGVHCGTRRHLKRT